jgi:hypothetical protein
MDEAIKDFISRELREHQSPYFEDGDIEHYYTKNKGDTKATIYEMLVIKSEDSTVSVSGLNTADTSKYFLRLAGKYRPHNSGVLSG